MLSVEVAEMEGNELDYNWNDGACSQTYQEGTGLRTADLQGLVNQLINQHQSINLHILREVSIFNKRLNLFYISREVPQCNSPV